MPKIIVKPGFAIHLLTIALTAWIIYAISQGLAPHLGTTLVKPTVSKQIEYVSLFMITHVLTYLIHELGHAAAGLALGLRWLELKLHAAGMRVSMSEADHMTRLVVALAGPATHLSLVVFVLALRGFPTLWDADPVAAAAWVLMADVVLNMLPFGRLDGGNAHKSLMRCLQGRSHMFN